MRQEPVSGNRAALERLDRVARWADSQFAIPGTRIRFGFESLIGLVPGVGDAAGLLLSLWLLNEARRAGAPRALLWRMAGNALLDAGAGALPVVGDAFDLLFKANRRNVDLLRAYLNPQAPLGAKRRDARWLAAALMVVSVILVIWWLRTQR